MEGDRDSCHEGGLTASKNNANMRIRSVVSLDERESRAPLRRQLSVDEERGCGGHWAVCEESGPDAVHGLRLYREFLLSEMRATGLRAPACAHLPLRCEFTGLWSWWWEGRALWRASKRYALTPRRAALRVRANAIQLAALDFPTFQHTLQTLFQEGGATLERVLALFNFLTDLSALALRSGLRAHFCRLTHWAAKHIADCATPWVARHGGWSCVVRDGRGTREEAATLAALTAAAAFAALCIYRMVLKSNQSPSFTNC